MKYRYEVFGGIISSDDPPFLAFVDRNYMRELGFEDSPLWADGDESVGRLAAPVEVHFSITNRCSSACSHCYMDAGEKDKKELDFKSVKRALDILAHKKIFHVALGGGEALERPDWFEIARYARKVGLTPNLTVSGLHITPNIAEKMRIFGQVNVSMDGVGEMYSVFRGKDMFKVADKAVDYLVQAGVPTGINCVIGRRNFESIPSLFEYAKKKKMNEIEFLRFKPSGRAGRLYKKHRIEYEQSIRLAPLLAELSKQYEITAKIDCSFVPMLCWHKPDRSLLESIATYGCEAGNVLWGIRADGSVSGCSFLKKSGISVFEPDFDKKGYFDDIIDWSRHAPSPCRECGYLDICKGGCRAVAEIVSGDIDINRPDPDCPFVIEYEEKSKTAR